MGLINKLFRRGSYSATRHEQPDARPMEVPLQRKRRTVNSLEDLRRMMYAINEEAKREGRETFEQANDFDVDEDFEDALAPAQLRHQTVTMARDAKFEPRPPKEVREAEKPPAGPSEVKPAPPNLEPEANKK